MTECCIKSSIFRKRIGEERRRDQWVILMILVLMLFSALLPEYAAFGQGESISHEQQLLTLLADPAVFNASRVEFTCEGNFYSQLKKNDFVGLYRVLVKAGYDNSQVSVSYNDFRHYVQISELSYTGLPWAECVSMDDVRFALSQLTSSQQGFVLLCEPDTVRQLVSGETLRRYMAQSGVESYYSLYSIETGIIKFSALSYFEVPYVFVQDFLQFSAAVSAFSDRGINDFYIVFEPELFARVSGDAQQNTIMIGSSKIGNHMSSTDPGACVIRYSAVEFTDVPREICRSVEDVPEAIRRMGAGGVRNFELIFPDTSVFDALFRDDFALLYRLEADAGMSSGSISYSSASDRIVVRDAVITADAVTLTGLSDALAYAEAQVKAGADDIHLFCSPELFDALLGNVRDFTAENKSLNRIYDLTAQSGIFDYDITVSNAARVINIHINALYPGRAVMRAVQSGNQAGLSPRDLEVWAAASQIAAVLRTEDPLMTAKLVHDWICDHVVYVDDDLTDEDDTAVGAILNGRANCDGYADAFYLIGSLAGLNVRYQHGDSFQRQNDLQTYSVSHMWNLLNTDGQWRMVDVTWDDEENGWSYLWFNVGEDIARRMHIWNADMTVPSAPSSDRRIHGENEYYVRSETELMDAVNAAYQARQSDFHILFEYPSLAYLYETGLSAVMDRCPGSVVTYSWNERMLLLSFLDILW